MCFIICILPSNRAKSTSEKPSQFSPSEAAKAEGGEGGSNTFSQVHRLGVIHEPVIGRVPAFLRGVDLRQLNTVSPTDIKNITGSLGKKTTKTKAIHSKKKNILGVVIIPIRSYQFHRLLFIIASGVWV